MVVCSVCLAGAQAVRAENECPSHTPISTVVAQDFYSDKNGSVVDQTKLAANLNLIKDLRSFVTDVALRLDTEGDVKGQQCAYGLMVQWAQARALLQPPSNFAGIRERERFVISLNIAALKLKSRGFPTQHSIIGWLSDLNHMVKYDFSKRGTADNLFAWSGVASATFVVLERDLELLSYSDEVWRRSLQQIRGDGFVDTELRRAGRALLYHQYNLSALLMMRAFREAAGKHAALEEDQVLRRLADQVARGLCDPKPISAAAGGYAQQRPSAADFRITHIFGTSIVDGRFERCGIRSPGMDDPILGGRLDRTREILAHWQTQIGRP
jgi:poly(beta-D-mannuronate) lyase